MIEPIRNILTSPSLMNVAQNTAQAITIETSLKAAGRPAFILMDNDISKDTKKYAAIKEFLYQATCLGVYMALVVPVFKKGGFKFAKEKLYKNTEGFEHFKNFKEFAAFDKIAKIPDVEARLKTIKEKNLKFNDALLKNLKQKEAGFANVTGAVALSDTIGSVLGLAILAPQVSHAFIHPAMKALGLEKKEGEQKLDRKA